MYNIIMKKSLKIWVIKLSIIAAIIVFDLLTKHFSAKYFASHDDIVLIPNFLALTFTTNTGAAFGIFSNSTIMLTFASVLFIIIIFWYDFSYKEKSVIYIISFSLIIGGALGNIIDRIFLGYVRDFLWVASAFICNFADIALSVGVAFYILHVILEYSKSKKTIN